MNIVAQLLCATVSLTGGVYCVWLLRNCRKPAQSAEEAVQSLPMSARLARWKSVCARINWLCQIVLATTFLAVATSMLATLAYRALSPLWEEPLVDQQMRRSVETALIQGCPPVLVDYDTSQPGGPVIGIDCVRKPISDNHLICLLHQAPKLYWLNLAHTDITDEALCELSRSPELLGLCLERTQIGDRRLDQLAKLNSLESLELDGTNITGKGLRHLADLKSLRKLYLNNTAVTDAGLAWLSSLDKLRLLDLRNTRVTEEGIDRLKRKLPGVIIEFTD